MSDAPVVSIVIDNFNYARYLRAAIDSALAQTWRPLEVVVVDDGSTDESPDVIASYADHIRAVVQANAGQGAAFNAGFLASRGAIVIFLDADDWLDPDAATSAVAGFAAGVTKVHWRLRVTDARGRPSGLTFPDGPMLTGDLRQQAIEQGPLYDSHHLPPTSGNAWSRRFLDAVLPMPAARFDHGADVYLHALAPIYGQLGAVDQTRGNYRQHGSNHYWDAPLESPKIDEYLARFDAASDALVAHLEAQGITADPERWQTTNFNRRWLGHLRQARADLATWTPAGASILLIDDAEWGAPRPIAGRPVVPFPEHDGQWAGRPMDDRHALAALAAAHAAGIRHVALWWTARWWLDSYPSLGVYLDRHGRRLVDAEHLTLYALTPCTSPKTASATEPTP